MLGLAVLRGRSALDIISDVPNKDLLATRQRHYAEILNDLFDHGPHMEISRFFEFICALVRVGGVELGGIDPWYESSSIIDDLRNLASLDLPVDRFPNPVKTQIRLALLAYCTLTEMDVPYMLLANLLRVRQGHKYQVDPFEDLARQRAPKKGGHPLGTFVPPTTNQKRKRISKLAEQANMRQVSTALEETYDAVVRNAVYHSDFVLQDEHLLVRKATRFSKKQRCFTPRIPLEELDETITNAFAFFGALFALYERCRMSFGDFKRAFIPYDLQYKGLMELVFDEQDRLIGFRVYWPNGTCGYYARTKEASIATNITFEQDGSINFMVGVYAARRGPFSPLVEYGAQPNYDFRPGTQLKPHWPDDLKPYKLP